jgi:hypothetical protein
MTIEMHGTGPLVRQVPETRIIDDRPLIDHLAARLCLSNEEHGDFSNEDDAA